MNRPLVRTLGRCLAIAAPLLLLPAAAEAHRTWLLPSSTILSGEDPWVTVDAASSNDLFIFEHRPMRLDDLAVTGPDGQPVKVENKAIGKFRSTFDLRLAASGTYRIAVVNGGYFARYKLGGEPKRWRGGKTDLATAIPADAQEVSVSRFDGRTETFVTAGAPTTGALEPTGEGLEMIPVTHPNDLYAGEAATFRFLMDGKPAAGLAVEIVPGGIRYRDQLGAIKVEADAEGRVEVTWPAAGLYWIGCGTRDEAADADGIVRRTRYSATLEVLPQ